MLDISPGILLRGEEFSLAWKQPDRRDPTATADTNTKVLTTDLRAPILKSWGIVKIQTRRLFRPVSRIFIYDSAEPVNRKILLFQVLRGIFPCLSRAASASPHFLQFDSPLQRPQCHFKVALGFVYVGLNLEQRSLVFVQLHPLLRFIYDFVPE